MRLFATLALIAAALFWSHPFLPAVPMKTLLAQIMPGEKRVKTPAFGGAPGQNRSLEQEAVTSSIRENSEGPRR
jgi:hypothetical protein